MPDLRFVETSLGPVRYAQAGRGKDVVLVHGAMTSVEDMLLGPFDALAARFRVTAFDRPGHGATPRRRLHGAPREQALHLLEAMDALGVATAVAAGQSFGAAVALEMALTAQERILGALAITPIAFPELRLEHLLYGPRALVGWGDAVAYGPGRLLDAALLPILWEAMFAPQGMPARFREQYPFALASGAGQMLALGEEAVLALPDLAASVPRLASCRTPVTVMAGGADWLSPPWAHAVPLAALLPKSSFRLSPTLGHMVHHFAIAEIVEEIEALSRS